LESLNRILNISANILTEVKSMKRSLTESAGLLVQKINSINISLKEQIKKLNELKWLRIIERKLINFK
jgi:hypothetical protein